MQDRNYLCTTLHVPHANIIVFNIRINKKIWCIDSCKIINNISRDKRKLIMHNHLLVHLLQI